MLNGTDKEWGTICYRYAVAVVALFGLKLNKK